MAGKRISQLAAAASLVASELVQLSKLSTTVTMTATTLSAQASDNSFNDSADQFIAEGFAVGDAVWVSGFTGNTANNIFSAVITALTAGKMTIGGTDGDVIVDDAAGESVTITKWDSVRASLTDLRALLTVPNVQSVTSSATVTPTFLDDLVIVTAQAAALDLANPTGTAKHGHGIVIRLKDNGTGRAITYGSQYRAIGITLPTTTVANKTTYIGMIYNATDTKWDCVSTGTEA